jgi:hypothetical protein
VDGFLPAQRRKADGCILETLWTPRRPQIGNERFGKGTASANNVVLSTFVLLTGVVQSVVTVMAAVRVMFVGQFAAIAVHDLAVESSRVSVALSVRVPVGK